MTTADIDIYLRLLTMAATLGASLVSIIKDHAKKELTDADFAALEARWSDLVDQTAQNAGI